MGVFGRRPGTEEVVCMSEGCEGRNLKRREAMKKWKAVLAVFLSIVLVLQSSNIQALADVIVGDGESGREEIVLDKPAEETEPSESTDEQKNTPPASEPKKEEPAEPAEPATPEEPADKKADSTKKDEPTQTTEPVEKAEETKPAEETEPAQTTEPSKETSSSTADKTSSPETEDTTATLKFDVTGATLTYNQDGEKNVTADTADKTAKVETTQDFKFTVSPDDGQQVASVKAVTSDGAESDVAANDSGEYTLAAANVTDGTTIKVTTEAVPEPETPAKEEVVGDADDAALNEIESASPAAAPMMLSIKAVDWSSFDAAVALFDENMQDVGSSDDQTVQGGTIADNVKFQIEVNGTLYDFVGAYVGDNQVKFAGSRGGSVYYAVAADSGIASLLPEGQEVTLRYQEHVDRHNITYNITGIDDTDGLVSGATNVVDGGSFDFTVRDVYGYEVTVNAAGQTLTGNNGVYSIVNVTDDVTVGVAYHANSTYNFTIPDTVRNSANAHGMMGHGAVPNQLNITVGRDLTFSFSTVRGQEGANWYLDSLEINDQTVAIPRTYNQGDSATTTLENGLTVVVTLTEVDDNGHWVEGQWWWEEDEWVTEFPEYTYTVTVSGAKEDVELTFINFVGSGHHEVMPHFDKNAVSVTYTGGVTGTASNEKPIQTTNGTLYFTIEALPGYEVTEVTLDGSTLRPNWQGKYAVSNTTTVVKHLDISSQAISYDVRYDMNGVSGSAPTDSTEYGVALERNLVISGAPETTEDKVFLGWRLGDKVYQPGEVVDVIGLLDQAQNHTLTFSAEWGTSIQEGQPVTMYVEVYLQNEDGSYPSSPDIRKNELAYGGDVVTVRDPETYLGDRTGYTFNKEKSTNEITLEGTTDTIKLYFDLPTIELTAASGGGVYNSGAYFLKNVSALAGESNEGVTIEYKYGDGDWTTEAPSVTNVDDSYNGNISVRARKSGYVTKQIDGLSIVVTKRPVAVTGSAEKPYDGNANLTNPVDMELVSVAGQTESGPIATDDISATQLHVGEATYAKSDVHTDEPLNINAANSVKLDGEDASNYEIASVTGTGTIKAADAEVVVTVVGNNDSFVYDGQEHEVTGYTVTGISAPEGLSYTEADFSFSGDATAARTVEGKTDMGLTSDDFSNTNGNFSNVVFNVTDGYVEITPQSITPGPDPDNPDPSYVDVQVDYPADVPYNGQDQTWVPTVTSNASAALVAGTDYDVTYFTNDRSNVTGDITVTITGKGNYKGTVERHYQITPLTITVTPDNLSKYVGQADPTLTSTYAGYVQGETAGWTGSLTREPGEAAGTYVISQGDLQLADNPDGNFLAQNYNLVVNNGIFTILDAPVTPGGGGGTPTPTPTPTPDGGNPTPVPGAPAVVTTGDDTTDDAADDAVEPEEAIEDDTTPMAGPTETIGDDGTPLADGKHEDCWVHWLILLGMILSAVYFVGVSVRRRKFTSSLLGYEDKVLGNDRDNA